MKFDERLVLFSIEHWFRRQSQWHPIHGWALFESKAYGGIPRDSVQFIIAFMSDVTRILSQIESGDSSAAENLLPIVYEELRKLASAKLAKENPSQTLQATALVHEAYLRLVDGQQARHWDSRGHFFSAAAEAMRRILIERARRSRVKVRHGQVNRIELDENVASLASSIDLIVFDDLLSELQANEPQAAELVKLRVFAGVSHQEAAELIGISRRVADRLWRIARAWLSREMKHS